MEFKGEYNYLSTFHLCSIYLTKDELIKYADEKLHSSLEAYYPEGITFKSVEHGYQALRTKDINDFISICNANNGYGAKMLSKDMKSRSKWSVYRLGIMTILNEKKFEQHMDLARKIAKINEQIHNDITYKDYYWGRIINEGKKGQDNLGIIINEQRKKYIEMFNLKEEVKNAKATQLGVVKNNQQDNVDTFIDKVVDDYFYVVDTETSGLDPKFWDIIELSAIKVNGNTFEIEDEFDIYINPGYKLPPQIVEFNQRNGTGICDELLQNEGLSMQDALEQFKAFVGDKPVIMGQNIPFDIKFINKLYNKIEHRDFEYDYVIDTLPMAKEKIPGKHNLGVLYSMIPNAPELSFHKSIDDVKATLEVFKWLAKSEYYVDFNRYDYTM